MISPITQMQIAFPIRLDRSSARSKQWWLALGCRLLETRLLQRLRFKYGEIYTVSVSRGVWRSVGLVWTRTSKVSSDLWWAQSACQVPSCVQSKLCSLPRQCNVDHSLGRERSTPN